jgi:uncharacterized protein (DUF2384 family)
MAPPRRRKGVLPVYAELACAAPLECIEMIRRGLPPLWVMDLAFDLRISADNLMVYLGLARSSVQHRLLHEERLTPAESDAVMALVLLVGGAMLVRGTVEAVSPDEQVVIAARLGKWLRSPLRELGRRAPLQFMDTARGRALVTALAARSDVARQAKRVKCTFSADT